MDKETKLYCEICKSKYSVFLTQHICKRCFRSCCKDCAPNKKLIFMKNSQKPQEHRLCKICWLQSEQIEGYVQKNKVIFGSISYVGKEWLEIISADVPQKKNKQEKGGSLFFQDLTQIWPSFTDSFRELLGLSLNKSTNIQPILQKLLNFCKNEGVEKQAINYLTHLVLFVGAHCHEAGSQKVLQYVLPLLQNFSIEKVIEKMKILSQSENKNLINYAKNNWMSFGYSFGIGICHIDVANMLMLEVLLTGSIEPLQNGFAYLVIENKQTILDEKLDENKIKLFIGRNFTSKNMEKGIKLIRKLQLKDEKMMNLEKEHNKKKVEESDEVAEKLDRAEQYLKALEKQPDKEPTLEEIEDMDNYLNQIIAQNDAELEEIEKLDLVLDDIMQEIKNKNSS